MAELDTNQLTDTANVTVVVGGLRPDDDQGLYQAPDVRSIWTDYVIVNRYEWNPHRYMAGITSPNGFNGQSAAFFQLAAPTLLWIAEWTAMKIGDVPEIPDLVPSGSDWVLLDAIPETYKLEACADGDSGRYRVNGLYVYGHKNPSDDVYDHVVFPQPPYLRDGLSRKIPTNKLQGNILDPDGSGESGGNLEEDALLRQQ